MTEQDKQLIEKAESVHMRDKNMPHIIESLILQAETLEARNRLQSIRDQKLYALDCYNYHLEEARSGMI